MSYQYRGNNNSIQPPLPPPPMMPGMGMMSGMSGTGYDPMQQNYNMNHNMMMPGLNDAPLEFNMNKNNLQPPLPIQPNMVVSEITSSPNDFNNAPMNMRESDQDGGRHNNSNSTNNRRRSRDRGRRDRNDKDHNRPDRSRSDYKGRKSDQQNDRGKSDKKDNGSGPGNKADNSIVPQVSGMDSQTSLIGPQIPGMNSADGINQQTNGITPAQQGLMYGGMGMGGMYPGNMMGMMGGMGGMMMDPNMMSMGQYGMHDPSQMGNIPIEGVVPGTEMAMMGMGTFPQMNQINKDIIQLKSCSLVPPYPSSVLPTTREKPPGCRTVFIGSLPENITEEILTEVFERCGEITSLRLSKKNFCHIRFGYEQSVDAAVFFSGYRIRIENKTDAANCSRLHVDYAQARDDQHEFECKQRAMQRESRHRERMAAKRRPPSPPPIHHYTDHDALDICDKIKQDDNFKQAVQVVISWLDRGDCNKKNVNVFYSMIQSTNSHVRRLLNDKTQYEEELQRAKDDAKIKMQSLLVQFGHVEKVFAAASHKKVWDHFSKAQRKNIEMWKKQSSEIRVLQLEDFLQETGGGEEMDVSDEEGISRKRGKFDDERAQEENDSLKCQLEAYKNEIDLMRSENMSEIDSKAQSIQQLKARVGVLENQLSQAKKHQMSENIKFRLMENKLKSMGSSNEKKDEKEDEIVNLTDSVEKTETKSVDIGQSLSDKEAKLIGVVSTFLHVHPFGASTDYLWSYVQKMEPEIRPNQLEDLLCRFPTVFVQNVSGVGANIERRWVFNGFAVFEA